MYYLFRKMILTERGQVEQQLSLKLVILRANPEAGKKEFVVF